MWQNLTRTPGIGRAPDAGSDAQLHRRFSIRQRLDKRIDLFAGVVEVRRYPQTIHPRSRYDVLRTENPEQIAGRMPRVLARHYGRRFTQISRAGHFVTLTREPISQIIAEAQQVLFDSFRTDFEEQIERSSESVHAYCVQ